MVEIGESSFAYLQIFYSLDYGIPLPNYKILCWVLALIFHIGCYIKDFESTNLIFSQKMSCSDNYDLPKSLEDGVPQHHASLPPPPPIILPHPQVLEKFKVTQSLLASIVYVCSHLGDKVTH